MKLLEPLALGSRTLRNRVFMAPLVRARSDAHRAPTDLVDIYYAQRAGAGLIVTEGCHISPQSTTRANASAQHTDIQTQAWDRVVRKVHEAGGIIFQQLYHVGRKALLSTMPHGELPVAPSAIEATGDNVGAPATTEALVRRHEPSGACAIRYSGVNVAVAAAAFTGSGTAHREAPAALPTSI